MRSVAVALPFLGLVERDTERTPVLGYLYIDTHTHTHFGRFECGEGRIGMLEGQATNEKVLSPGGPRCSFAWTKEGRGRWRLACGDLD